MLAVDFSEVMPHVKLYKFYGNDFRNMKILLSYVYLELQIQIFRNSYWIFKKSKNILLYLNKNWKNNQMLRCKFVM